MERHRVGVGCRVGARHEGSLGGGRQVEVDRELTEDVDRATGAERAGRGRRGLVDDEVRGTVDDRTAGVGVQVIRLDRTHTPLRLLAEEQLGRAGEGADGAGVAAVVDSQGAEAAAEAVNVVGTRRKRRSGVGAVRSDAADVGRTEVHLAVTDRALVEGVGEGDAAFEGEDTRGTGREQVREVALGVIDTIGITRARAEGRHGEVGRGARQHELARAGDVGVAFEVDDRARIDPDQAGAERGGRTAGIGARGIGTEADAGRLALVAVGDQSAGEAGVRAVDPERALPVLEEGDATGVVVDVAVEDRVDVVVDGGVAAQIGLAEDVQGVARARAGRLHVEVVVAADGEVLEAEQLVGGSVDGSRADVDLGAAVDDQADGTGGLAERDAFIGGRAGVILELKRTLVERDGAVTETAAHQLIEGGITAGTGEGGGTVDDRTVTAGDHEAARPIVEAGDAREHEVAVLGLDQAGALVARAGDDAVEGDGVTVGVVDDGELGVVAGRTEVQGAVEGELEGVAVIELDDLSLFAGGTEELEATKHRDGGIGSGGTVAVEVDVEAGVIETRDQAAFEAHRAASTEVVDAVDGVHHHVAGAGRTERAGGTGGAQDDAAAVDDDVTRESLLVGVQLEVVRTEEVQGADERELAGRRRVRDVTEEEGLAAVATAEVKVGRAQRGTVAGDDLVDEEAR